MGASATTTARAISRNVVTSLSPLRLPSRFKFRSRCMLLYFQTDSHRQLSIGSRRACLV